MQPCSFPHPTPPSQEDEKNWGRSRGGQEGGSKAWDGKWTKLAADSRQTKGGRSSQKSHKDIWGVGSLSSRRDERRKEVRGGLLRVKETMFGLGSPCITNSSNLKDYSGTICMSCSCILPEVPVTLHHHTWVLFLLPLPYCRAISRRPAFSICQSSPFLHQQHYYDHPLTATQP